MENRATFFERLQPLLAPSDLMDVQLAYTLSKYSHRAQVRQEKGPDGLPLRYFEHVRRAALVLLDEAKIADRDMIISALLHDCIEDTDLTPEMIEHYFGRDVVLIVKTLSKVPEGGYLERFRAHGDWRSYVVKACDRLDNLRSLSQATPEFRLKQVTETEAKYLALFDHMVVLTPPDYVARVQNLKLLIEEELLRQKAALGQARTAPP